MLAGLCILGSGAALAQSDDIGERVLLDGRIAPRIVLSDNRAEPLATTEARSALGARAGGAATARQTMLWIQPARSALALGLGVEQRQLDQAAGHWRALLPVSGLLAGVSLLAGPGARLTLQTPLLKPSGIVPEDGSELGSSEGRQLRMGLVFDSKKAGADLRRGLRVELSGQTTLALRPRGGGRIGLSLQRQW